MYLIVCVLLSLVHILIFRLWDETHTCACGLAGGRPGGAGGGAADALVWSVHGGGHGRAERERERERGALARGSRVVRISSI